MAPSVLRLRVVQQGTNAFWGQCPFRVDFVAKVFLGCRTKIPRAADAFYVQRREGPYRFIQNRSRTSVAVLKSDAAAEKPKDQLWRDFSGCSIFDFCNKIGTKLTLAMVRSMSASADKADISQRLPNKRTFENAARLPGQVRLVRLTIGQTLA